MESKRYSLSVTLNTPKEESKTNEFKVDSRQEALETIDKIQKENGFCMIMANLFDNQTGESEQFYV